MTKFSRTCEKTASGLKNIKTTTGVKLPKLVVNSFSGDPLEWVTFMETFEVAVHTNEHLTEIEKFTYLQGYLKGVAAQSIKGFYFFIHMCFHERSNFIGCTGCIRKVVYKFVTFFYSEKRLSENHDFRQWKSIYCRHNANICC